MAGCVSYSVVALAGVSVVYLAGVARFGFGGVLGVFARVGFVGVVAVLRLVSGRAQSGSKRSLYAADSASCAAAVLTHKVSSRRQLHRIRSFARTTRISQPNANGGSEPLQRQHLFASLRTLSVSRRVDFPSARRRNPPISPSRRPRIAPSLAAPAPPPPE